MSKVLNLFTKKSPYLNNFSQKLVVCNFYVLSLSKTNSGLFSLFCKFSELIHGVIDAYTYIHTYIYIYIYNLYIYIYISEIV